MSKQPYKCIILKNIYNLIYEKFKVTSSKVSKIEVNLGLKFMLELSMRQMMVWNDETLTFNVI